jgi:hypothetical protein
VVLDVVIGHASSVIVQFVSPAVFRLTCATLFAIGVWPVPAGSPVRVAQERAAGEVVSARLAEWLGPSPTTLTTRTEPAFSTGAPWLASPFDIASETALARARVEQYTRDLFAPPSTLQDELSTYLTNRLAEEIFQQQTSSTAGAGFVIEPFFGGFLSYAVRSIRLERGQLARTDRFTTLERYVGWPELQSILREFYARAAGRRVPAAEFVQVASGVSGRDLTWLFDALSDSARTIDYGVKSVSDTVGVNRRHRTTVVVGRYGDGVFAGTSQGRVGPFDSGRSIEIRVVFGDGSVRDERWDGRDLRRAFEYESTAGVTSVDVDPRRIIAADHRLTNNSWTAANRAGEAATRWAARWLTWFEHVLLSYAFFA